MLAIHAIGFGTLSRQLFGETIKAKMFVGETPTTSPSPLWHQKRQPRLVEDFLDEPERTLRQIVAELK
jgi:hypothetical protein